jgi:hypothetical protein
MMLVIINSLIMINSFFMLLQQQMIFYIVTLTRHSALYLIIIAIDMDLAIIINYYSMVRSFILFGVLMISLMINIF